MSCSIMLLSAILVTSLLATPQTGAAYKLTILHTNDVHSRFQESNVFGGMCTDADRGQQGCFGGVARLGSKLTELRALHPNNIVVDAGGQFQGTLWFYQYKGKAAAHFMNKLNYDAMTLGTPEFGNGVNGLNPFLNNVTFSVLSANINASMEPTMRGLLKTSLTRTRGGQKIGIVGYTSTETAQLTNTGSLIFDNVVSSVQAEVNKLVAAGINKIVVLGYAGFAEDQKLAQRLKGVDVVVGGGTNTFLYSGTPPSIETADGEYPTVVTQANGNKVLVVNDYAFGKYLGFLQVDFDNDGHVVSWSGNPILLSTNVTQDSALLNETAAWYDNVDNMKSTVVGKSRVLLVGPDVCRVKECNLGNLFADACVQRNAQHPEELRWQNTSIALINSGSINASISGDITIGKLFEAWPFRNTIDIVEIRGSLIRQILEFSVSDVGEMTTQKPSKLLQFSGLLVLFDKSRAVGSRVLRVEALCSGCNVPEYRLLEDGAVYKVIMSSYMINGGDGFTMIKANIIKHHLIGDMDIDIVAEYVEKFSPITAGLERRTQFLADKSLCYFTGGSRALEPFNLGLIFALVVNYLIVQKHLLS